MSHRKHLFFINTQMTITHVPYAKSMSTTAKNDALNVKYSLNYEDT